MIESLSQSELSTLKIESLSQSELSTLMASEKRGLEISVRLKFVSTLSRHVKHGFGSRCTLLLEKQQWNISNKYLER